MTEKHPIRIVSTGRGSSVRVFCGDVEVEGVISVDIEGLESDCVTTANLTISIDNIEVNAGTNATGVNRE